MADVTSSDAIPVLSPISLTDRHRLYEDIVAMLIGTSFVSLGLTLYAQANLMTGSTAGVALLVHYATNWQFALTFFVINLPFYYLAIKRMGWRFTIRTFIAVALMSVFTRLFPLWVDFSTLQPIFAAFMGGTLMGMGVLALFRHRAGVGGINILALYLQDNYNIRAGWFQLSLDLVLMAVSLFFLSPQQVAISLIGAVVMNIIIAINHKPGRYLGTS
ncbi:YitT family protein [Pseudochrobactrum sp. MP213Fo]|uniref:YitT family protein n=1 Tax=Pseudochrobactrum sp. MP213Fo TaxID=3022250 RepID=UPI003BA04F08